MSKSSSSIVLKIFIAIIVIFIVVLAIQLIFQKFILQEWYFYSKTKQTEEHFTEFLIESDHDLEGTIQSFVDLNNSPILMIEKDGAIVNYSYFEQFTWIVVESDNNKYKLNMDSYTDEESEFISAIDLIEVGSTISGLFIKIPGTEIYEPLVINGFRESVFAEYLANGNLNEIVSVDGIVTEVNLVERPEGIGRYQSSKLIIEMINYLEHDFYYKKNEKVSKVEFVEEYSGLHLIVFVGEKIVEGESIICFTLITLENIEETFDVLNNYYFIIFGIQLILAVVVVFFLTRWITRPVLQLNIVAKGIAAGDFSVKSDIVSKDELGELSDNLNLISDNLSKTISELKISNENLEIEVTKRKKNETRMRNILAGLSHEFKTPLGIISGFIEIIKAGVGDKEPEYYLNSIEVETDRLGDMVQETLELTKLESGLYKLNLTEFNVVNLVKEQISLLENLFNDKEQIVRLVIEHAVTSDRNKDELIIHADRNKIGQVLRNLLINASSYSPNKAIIKIMLFERKETVGISIFNDSVTLLEKDLESVWNRFFRVEKSRNKEQGGHGLGLSIVYNILKLHGSEVVMKNNNSGVEVSFELEK